MDTKITKQRFLIVLSTILAVCLAIGVWFGLSNNASAQKAYVSARQSTDVLIANADDTDAGAGDVEDKGEVQKGDIIDYWLEATYVGYNDDRSGIVTFTDVLPEHMELVTGTQTVAGKETDCTPTVTNSSGVTWADPENPYTYESSTRTFTAQVANIPASQGADTGNIVRIHVYAKIVDDAESLGVDNVYYTNYVTITHAAASSVSNKVQFHSGNLSEETYKIAYKFADGSSVPNGATAPVDDSTYSKGSDVTVQPNMSAQGYKFGGWKLVTDGLTAGTYTYDEDAHKFKLNNGTDGVSTVTFEGSWTENDKIDVNYDWQGKIGDINSADSADDKPNINVPDATKADEATPVSFPNYPATDDVRNSNTYKADGDSYSDIYKQYSFLGWKVFTTDVDGAETEQELSAAEKKAGEFTPTASSGKKVKSIKMVGYWTKREFTLSYALDGDLTNWADANLTEPTSTKHKWGTNIELPSLRPIGYRFIGWNTKPDLGSGATTQASETQYVMPSSDVTATATFSKTYTVNMTSGTASTANVTEGSQIEAMAGENVTVKPLQDLEDVRFKDWDTAVSTDDRNWIKKDDGTATFVMPANDVDVAGKYISEVDFLVVNGKWLDGTTGYKMKEVDVTQQADSTWKGSLASGDVPTGMAPDFSHKDTGKWGDGTTAAQNPNTYVGTDLLTFTNSGKANHLTLFTYYFNDALDDITVTYSVKTGQSDFGTVTLNKNGETAKQTVSETFDPLGTTSTPVGATAKANAGYKFVNWTKGTDTDAFSLDENFVPFKIINTGSTTEFYEKADYVANFEQNKFTVKFDANKGNGSSDVTGGPIADQEMTYNAGTKLTKNSFKRTGYVFDGWNTAANGSGTKIADQADGSKLSTTDKATVTLYAQWKAQKVTVKYNSYKDNLKITGQDQDGTKVTESTFTGTMADHVFTYDVANQKLDANAFKLKGYTFTSWANATATISIKYKDDEAAITNDEIATACGDNETAEINLYTYWTPIKYKFTYKKYQKENTSEIVGNETTQEFTYDVGKGIDQTPYTRTGYLFQGWDTNKDLSNTQNPKFPGRVTVLNYTDVNGQNTDFYAIWHPITYKVSYDVNAESDDTTSGSTKGQDDGSYDSDITINGNGFKRDGYTFKEWNTKPDGTGTSYSAEKAAKNLTDEDKKTVQLYALWTPNDYTVKFDLNDGVQGTNPEASPSSYADSTVHWKDGNLISGKTPTRPGYEFKGWRQKTNARALSNTVTSSTKYRDFNVTGTSGGVNTYDDTVKDITLEAIWEEKPNITINYETDFSLVGNIDRGWIDFTEDTLAPATGTPKKNVANAHPGYKLKEWKDKATGSVVGSNKEFTPQKNSELIYETKTYVAVFDVDIAEYKVKYYQEQADGTFSEVANDTKTLQKSTASDPDVTADSFTNDATYKKAYSGYSATPTVKYFTTDAGEVTTPQTVAADGSLEIRAYYARNTHNVTFDRQGHGTNPSPITGLRWGNKVTNPGNLTEDGWTFGGWYKDATCSSANKWDFNVNVTEDDDLTLYAKWTQNTYTVKYDVGNGATNKQYFGDMPNVTWQQASLWPATTPTRKGYTFKNWTVSGDTQNREVSATLDYSTLVSYIGGDDQTSSVTLKAIYDKIDKDKENKTGDVTVYANNIRMNVEEATSLLKKDSADQLSEILTRSDAFAEQDDETPVTITTLNHGIKAQAGQYEFTLSTAGNASVTATAYVYDKTDTQGKAAIGAMNFRVSVADVTNLGLDNGTNANYTSNIIGLAHAYAWNTDTREDIGIGNIAGTIEAVEGVYDITFWSNYVGSNRATVTIQCTVYTEGASDSSYRITASNFAVKKGTNVTDADMIALGNAKAVGVSTGNEYDVTLDRGDFDSSEVGQYDVKYTVSGRTAPSVNVVATVFDETAEKDDEVIGANHFTLGVDEVNDSLTDDNLIARANAKAYEKDTGKNIDVKVANRGGLTNVEGVYRVTFTTDKGTNVTVNATVLDKSADANGIRISANNFTVSTQEVGDSILKGGTTPDKEALVKYANASAVRIADSGNVGIASAASTPVIAAEKGTYAITFTSNDLNNQTAEIEVTMTVTDEASRGNTVDIFANNFSVSIGEVTADKLGDATAGFDSLVKLAKAHAYDKYGKVVNVVSATSDIQPKLGKYAVSFTSEEVDGESSTVNVIATVKDKATEDTTNEERITANHFSMTIAEAGDIENGTLSADEIAQALIKRANAEAVSMVDGAVVSVASVDYSAIKAVVANYPVIFATAKGTSVSVFAKVSDNVEVDGNVAIDAQNFDVSVADVNNKKLDDALVSASELISLASARAWNTNTFEPIDITEVKSSIEAKRGTYGVTFTTTDGTDEVSKAVKANVKDNKIDPVNPDPKPDPDPDKPEPKPDPDPDQPTPSDIDIYMLGNDIYVPIDDVKKFNLDDGSASLDKLIELSDVVARKYSDGNYVDIVKATSTIKPEKGIYSVVFETDKVDDKSLTLEVKAEVYDGGSVVPDPDNPDSGISMVGNNFSLSQAEADAISKGTVLNGSAVAKAYADGKELDDGQKELVRLARVKAFRTDDGYELGITNVTFPYTGDAGDYPVTFESETGSVTSKLEVTATVTNESAEDFDNGERIFANNISYTYAEAEELLAKSNDDIATQLAQDANAHATSTVDGSDVEVTGAEWNIQAAEGVYDVTFSTEKGTSVSVKAAVGEKPLDPSALAALSKTGDNTWNIVAMLVFLVVLSVVGVEIYRRKSRNFI